MTSRQAMRGLVLAIASVATACYPQLAAHEPVVPPGLERLHESVIESRRDYERGLELLASGDAVLGRNLVVAATNRLVVYAQECARLADCEPSLILRTLDQFDGSNGSEKVAVAMAGASMTGGARGRDASDSPFIEVIPELGRAVSLLRGTELRDVITVNGPVKAALHDWLTWNQPVLIAANVNYQYLRHKIAPIYAKAGLPEALLFAVMAKEAGGKVHVYSRAGAAGPLQFMPQTARRYGLGAEDGFDMRLDPAASAQASAEYLNDQFSLLNQNLEKTLAAYNAGETRVRRLNRQLRGADFWAPEMYYALPAETRDYVPQVLAAAWLFLHSEEYGIEFPTLETNTTEIVLTEDIALDELTICLGTARNRNGWYRAIRNLNPRHRPGRRIPAGTTVELPSVLVRAYADRCVGDAALRAIARDLHYASEHESVIARQ